MASSANNKATVVRAAAILTTGEVAASSLDLNDAWASKVCIDADFTLGSLTNVILRFYVSLDGTTFVPYFAHTGAVITQTLTATARNAYVVEAPGWKFLRVSAQGTGTVTSSSLTLTARYLRRGSQ